jgi:F-type H+-transporting ATPase subunit b
MTRQPVLALGLLALALSIAPMPRATAALPQGTHAPVAEAKHDAGHATEGEHAATTPNILEPQAPLAIWTVVVFVILLAILAKFAWKPMMKALHDREEHIEHCLLEAEKARNEAERMMIENQKNLARAAEQARALLEEAKHAAEVSAATIVQKAQAEAEATFDRGKREIETARDQALTEIFSKTADLAIAVAGKVLSRDLTEADHKRLIETAMGELPAMANGQGARS